MGYAGKKVIGRFSAEVAIFGFTNLAIHSIIKL